MRKSDVISLIWDQVNMEKRLIFNRNSKAVHLRPGKTGSGRWVPMAEPLWDLFLNAPRHGQWVFPSPRKRGPITNISKWWRQLCARAGVENARIHDLRHTAATYLAMATGSTMTGQRILGHHTGKMAERYAHPDHEWLRTGVDAAATLMAPVGQ